MYYNIHAPMEIKANHGFFFLIFIIFLSQSKRFEFLNCKGPYCRVVKIKKYQCWSVNFNEWTSMPIFSLSYSFDIMISLWYKDYCILNIKHSFLLFKTLFLTTDSSTHAFQPLTCILYQDVITLFVPKLPPGALWTVL